MGERQANFSQRIPYHPTELQEPTIYDNPVHYTLVAQWYSFVEEVISLQDHPSFCAWFTDIQKPVYIVAHEQPLAFHELPPPRAADNEQRLYTAHHTDLLRNWIRYRRSNCVHFIDRYIGSIVREAYGSSLPPSHSVYKYILRCLRKIAGLDIPTALERRTALAILYQWRHQES